MKIPTINISQYVAAIVCIIVLGYPNSSALRAPIIIGALLWTILSNRFFKYNAYSKLHFAWAILFLIYVNLSRFWAYTGQGIADVNRNVMFTVMVSIVLEWYVVKYDAKPEHVKRMLCPAAMVFFLNFMFNRSVNVSHGNRISVSINENTFGAIAIGFFCYFLFSYKQKKGNRFINIVCIIFLGILALLSGSKRATICLIISIITILVFEVHTSNLKKKLAKIVETFFAICIIYLAITKIPFIYNIVGIRLETFLNVFLHNSEADGSTYTRMNMAQTAFEIFKTHPLLGVGANNFKYMTHYNTYAHMGVLEILCDFGIIGFLIYYFPFIYWLVQSAKAWKQGIDGAVFPLLFFMNFFIGDFMGVSYFSYSNHAFMGLAIGLMRNIRLNSISYNSNFQV